MNIIFIMLPLAVALAAMFVAFCVRAIREGQFDDLDTPPVRAVFDDEDDIVASDVLPSTTPRSPRPGQA